MSHLRETPDERNKCKSARATVSLLLRPAMHETLLQMFEESQGAGGTKGNFESFLTEHLENIAAEYRAKAWRAAHPNEGIRDRKADRPGAAYVNAAADLQEQEDA